VSFLQRINLILRNGHPSKYQEKVKQIIDIGIKINEKDAFPIWGTCLGFESLLFALSNYKLKTFRVKTKNQSIPISWDPVNYPDSDFKKVLR